MRERLACLCWTRADPFVGLDWAGALGPGTDVTAMDVAAAAVFAGGCNQHHLKTEVGGDDEAALADDDILASLALTLDAGLRPDGWMEKRDV